MFEKRAMLTVPLPLSAVFRFLQTRYESSLYRQASTATKGYVPQIEIINTEENRRVEFRVRGRDPVLKIFIGGWRWGYELKALSEAETEVEIWYSYGLWMALWGAGTIGHQAANEIAETAISLDALSQGVRQTIEL